MKVLAIETSCDDTAMAVLETIGKSKIRVQSNIISSQVRLHAKYGGVFPHLAAREHAKNIDKVLRLALREAGLKTAAEVDLIAVTHGPGLIVSLLVGVTFAKTLAWKYKKPLVGVNHLEGHIASNGLKPIGQISNFQSLIFKPLPALCLIVSGGHTSLVLMSRIGRYQIIGETQDDAVGEAFDKVARLLGLGYPGGPLISKLSEKGDPNRYLLPRPMLKSKNYAFSYSGLKTAVLYLIKDLKKNFEPGKDSRPTGLYGLSALNLNLELKADIAASFQKAAVEVLVQKTLSAARKLKVKSVLLSGGVSTNRLLREKLESSLAQSLPRVIFRKPDLLYTTDNAAMIGLAGYLTYVGSKGKTDFTWKSVQADANLGFKKSSPNLLK